MTTKKRLSVCVIMNNDEEYLPNCINSIKNIADEIMIVNRGLKDLAVDIQSEDKLSFYNMKPDSGINEVKNFCFEHAMGEWVLFLQADEIMEISHFKELTRIISNPNVEGYLLYYEHKLKNKRIISPIQNLRLIRNRKRHRYQYKVFERIQDEDFINIDYANIQIIQQKEPTNLMLNFMLLHDELIKNPQDSYLLYMYGLELLNQGRYKESIHYFDKSLTYMNLGNLFAPHLYKCLSWVHIYLNEYDRAQTILEEGLSHYPTYTDFLVLRAEIFRQKQKYLDAVSDLEQSIKRMGNHPQGILKPEISSSVIFESLGDMNQQIYNYQKSLFYYLKSFSLDDKNVNLIKKIGDIAKQIGNGEVVENLLKEKVNTTNIEILVMLIDVLLKLRRYNFVLKYIDKMDGLKKNIDLTFVMKHHCYMMLGNFEMAEQYFSTIKKDSPFYDHLLMQRIEFFWVFNKYDAVSPLLAKLEISQTIDTRTVTLYKEIHDLLTEKEIPSIKLLDYEYEMVLNVFENYLWKGNITKAKRLLPLLLEVANDNQLQYLAEQCVLKNDLELFENIYPIMSSKQCWTNVKKKILIKLLKYGHLDFVQKITRCDNEPLLDDMDYVFSAILMLEKINKLKSNLKLPKNRLNDSQIIDFQKVDHHLITFYQQFRIQKNLEIIAEYSNSKIHEEIGKAFEAEKKYNEAFIAYLRALQSNPLNFEAHKKVISLYEKDTFNLVIKNLYMEGKGFSNRESFALFILGIVNFYNQQYEEALNHFMKIKHHNLISVGYIICVLLIIGKEKEAEEILYEQNKPNILTLVDIIYHNFVLDFLEVGHKKFSHSELIANEKIEIKQHLEKN